MRDLAIGGIIGCLIALLLGGFVNDLLTQAQWRLFLILQVFYTMGLWAIFARALRRSKA